MLSILIPIYNFDVAALVKELHIQARDTGIVFEILCYDDKSDESYRKVNREISSLQNVIYKELPFNTGRSGIRNTMADDAKYGFLLFLDCDSEIASKDFLKNYLSFLRHDTVIVGGRSYKQLPPSDKKKYLRWYYGINRECVPLEIRRQKPYTCFLTNNFMVHRAVYSSIRLNEDLKGYGHEDTLFIRELKTRAVRILHIDNPLLHVGLDDAGEFIKKTNEGVKNLAYLIDRKMIDRNVKLYRYYIYLHYFSLTGIVYRLFRIIEKKLLENLFGSSPSLVVFDFYKLGRLLQEIAHG